MLKSVTKLRQPNATVKASLGSTYVSVSVNTHTHTRTSEMHHTPFFSRSIIIRKPREKKKKENDHLSVSALIALREGTLGVPHVETQNHKVRASAAFAR